MVIYHISLGSWYNSNPVLFLVTLFKLKYEEAVGSIHFQPSI